MEEYRINREEVTLFCRRQGRGPGLLLIHGVACDGSYFAETAEILAKRFTVITYDRRGYSHSDVKMQEDDGNNLFELEKQVEDAAEIIKDSGLGAVFVVGSSAGGIVAAQLAVSCPQLVRGLFLHEPVFAGGPVKEELDILNARLLEARKKKRMIRALLAFTDFMGGMDERAKCKSLEQQAQDLENLKIFVNYEMESFLGVDPDVLRQIQAPVWVAVGECDESGLFHRAARLTAEEMRWNLLFVPGYHNLPSDLPMEFAVAVSGVYELL